MTSSAAKSGTWYWCLEHRRVEPAETSTCPPSQRLGPYETKDAAERWKEKLDARNQRWDAQDKEWNG